MPILNADSNKLFCKFLTFCYKDSLSNTSRNCRLLLSIEWKSPVTTLQKKELFITLAADNDPFFLYMLTINNDDFIRLKHHQGLLVDFLAFPQSVIDLLELCLIEENEPSPRHVLNLTVEPKTSSINFVNLEIEEINRFKIITHLSLKLEAPDDEFAKQYLTRCFKTLKEEQETLAKTLNNLESDFKIRSEAYQEELKVKIEELEHLKEELNLKLSVKDKKHHESLTQARKTFEEFKSEESRRCERELKEKEERFLKETRELKRQLANEETKCKAARVKNLELEDRNSELQNHARNVEKELQEARNHIENYKKHNRELLPELEEMKSKLTTAMSDCEFWQKENSSKEMAILDLRNNLRASIEEKNFLEETLQQTQEHLEKCQCSQKELALDINTANNIIQKMQAEARLMHEKRKTAGMMVMKLQQDLKAKERHVADLEKEVTSSKLLVKEKKDEIKNLSTSASVLQKKLNDIEERLAEKENVLQYWNEHMALEYQTAQAFKKDGPIDGGGEGSGPHRDQRGQDLDPRYLQKDHNIPVLNVVEEDGSFIEAVYGNGTSATVQHERPPVNSASTGNRSSKAVGAKSLKSNKQPRTIAKQTPPVPVTKKAQTKQTGAK